MILHLLKIQSFEYLRIDPKLTDELQLEPINGTFVTVEVDADFVFCMHTKWLYTFFFFF